MMASPDSPEYGNHQDDRPEYGASTVIRRQHDERHPQTNSRSCRVPIHDLLRRVRRLELNGLQRAHDKSRHEQGGRENQYQLCRGDSTLDRLHGDFISQS